jgi:hypothetical protein
MRKRSTTVIFALGTLACCSIAFGEPYMVVPVSGRVDHVFDDNGLIYVTAGSTIVRYDLINRQLLSPFNIGGTLAGIDISPDGHTLAVADLDTYGFSSKLHLVDVQTGIDSTISFPLSSLESGTFMAVWGGDSRILVSSTFAGSGWVPLRRYDPSTGVTEVVGTINQDSMLSASADLTTIGLVEGNSSDGPVSAYSASSGSIVATTTTNRFLFELAVDPSGRQFAVPSYAGMAIYDLSASTFQLRATIGQNASHGPIGVVYSPVSNHLFTAEYDFSATEAGVKVYDTTNLTLVQSLDTYPFDWTGNHAFADGRTKISRDGRWLGVSADSTVRVYDVSSITNPQGSTPASIPAPLPATSDIWILLTCLSVVALAWRHAGSMHQANV